MSLATIDSMHELVPADLESKRQQLHRRVPRVQFALRTGIETGVRFGGSAL